MASLVLPDSSFYINCARGGVDPFVALAARLEDYEFATCGMVVLEVCRGRSNPALLQRFRERFAIMPYIAAGASVWEQATQLAWSLDRRGAVLPAADLLIAACALQARAAVLSLDAHFREIPGLKVLEGLD
ncbi:MAG: PIN domain-containing protein [Opitutaceae bacterium]|nr:PIN domain-containing protein [Opitutaceae bacterium]